MFIGAFHTGAKGQFIELVERLDVGEQVEVIPWLAYDELLHYVTLSRVGLVVHQRLHRFELLGKGNGRKLFTYMKCGVPAVVPGFGEIGGIAREERCGLSVDTTNAQEIADAVLHLIDNPDEAAAMGEQGKRAIDQKYNWGLEREKLLSAYPQPK